MITIMSNTSFINRSYLMMSLAVTPEPVATPTTTPEPHHPEESPSAAHQAPTPPDSGDPELPLDEDRSEEQLDSQKPPLYANAGQDGRVSGHMAHGTLTAPLP